MPDNREMMNDDMSLDDMQHSAGSYSNTVLGKWQPRTAASYESELTQVRGALARAKALIGQKDELIQQQEAVIEEADHRMMNGLQMIVSLLSLQSRTAANAETASLLADAANRVGMIERVQWRLHRFDGATSIAFKQYLEHLCRDFSKMLSLTERLPQVIAVEGIETRLPTGTARSLGLIVNELITNAVKYGKGRIMVRFESNPGIGYALSVSNDGSVLPDGFDPTASKGLGMKIIRSYVGRIGGELQFGRGDNNQGTRFTVLFC